MNELIRKLYWIITQFGIDPRRAYRSVVGIPRFAVELYKFNSGYKGKIKMFPCLQDWREQGGTTRTEYFRQDLYVAQLIFAANPKKHVDIGSRIDGFVAHVASFRKVEIFDIRPVDDVIPNVIFKQADFTNPKDIQSEYADSLSCLHALEHFGLGRYGDTIDPHGYKKGFANMALMLRPKGTFYLSVPIGNPRVEFNAHRIFDPDVIVQLGVEHNLVLDRFAWLDRAMTLKEIASPGADFMDQFKGVEYALGIFTFSKK